MQSSPNDEITRLQERVRDLEAVLGQKDNNIARTFSLSPGLSDFLGLLLSVPNVTPEMVRRRLSIATDSKVAVFRLRAALKPHNVTIHNRRGSGYWIEVEDKIRLRELLTPQVTSDGVDSGREEEAAAAGASVGQVRTEAA